MSRKFQCKIVPSSWIEHYGRRLDSGPYLSGAIEAKEIIQKLHYPKDTLEGITDDIYSAGRESIRKVSNPEVGVPLVASWEITSNDLSNLPYISKKQIEENPKFLIREGYTLITRSGIVGRIAYTRSDMDGFACSDAIRIVPNSKKALPGYIYTFLSSRFGLPLVLSGTYGAIIQHIEPHQLSGLQIPRLGNVEEKAHELIQKAANDLSKSQRLMIEATNQLLENAGLQESKNYLFISDSRKHGWTQTKINSSSLRALNYDPRVKEFLNALLKIKHDQLGEVINNENFDSYKVFKVIDCDPEFGMMLIGQKDAFNLRPDGRIISKRLVENLGLLVPPGTTMIPSAGTFGEFEVYCRAVLVTERSAKNVFSSHFYRCIPKNDAIDAGYLYAFLRSRMAFRIMRAISTGSKQQHQHPKLMASLPIPRIDSQEEKLIAKMVDEAAKLRDHALDLEDEARALVERTIEEGNR